MVSFSIAAIALVASAQTRELRLVSSAWTPFTNGPGQPRYALDLVEAALGRIGITAKTTIVEANQYTPSLLEGPFDGSAAAWRDAEREKTLIFSRPYLENRLILVGRRGADVSAPALSDLKGKKVAIVEGYSYGNDVDASGPTFVRSKSEEDSLRQLLRRSVDYTLMDELVVQYILDHYSDEARKKLQIGSTPVAIRALYFVLRRDLPDAQSIIDRFNEQLRALMADRTYHRLIHVEWIRADIDGDGIPEYVPLNDKQGRAEPQHAYTLLSPQTAAEQPAGPEQRHYYFGGNIYSDWASVPQSYKGYDNEHPDPARSTGTIFTFKW